MSKSLSTGKELEGSEMNSEGILEQDRYLQYLGHELDDLISGRAATGNQRVMRAIIREGLASVRQAISARNAYWENSEKLKELERRFFAFAYGEIDGQTLHKLLNLYAEGGWLEEVKNDPQLHDSETMILVRATGNYGPPIVDKIHKGYLDLLVEHGLVEAEDWKVSVDLPNKKSRRFCLTDAGRSLGSMSEDRACMYFARVGIWASWN